MEPLSGLRTLIDINIEHVNINQSVRNVNSIPTPDHLLVDSQTR
jgi:hypothetical protein